MYVTQLTTLAHNPQLSTFGGCRRFVILTHEVQAGEVCVSSVDEILSQGPLTCRALRQAVDFTVPSPRIDT